MSIQNDQEADLQLLERPPAQPERSSERRRAANEEAHAWAPTRQDQLDREWNGLPQPAKVRDQPRRGFVRRHPIAVALGVPLLLLTGAGGYLQWDYSSHFQTTDDAFIAARQFAIAPKVPGYLTAVPVTDNQHVVAGQAIARIDERDYRNALAVAQAQVAAGQASIETIEAQIVVQQAQVTANRSEVDQVQAALVFAQQQAKRYQDLAKTAIAGTVQDAQRYTSQLSQQTAALQAAEAKLKLAQQQIAVLVAQRASALANLAQAKAQRDQAQLNLSYTTVTADQPGRVVQLGAAVGEFAQPGTNLTMFVPDDTWV